MVLGLDRSGKTPPAQPGPGTGADIERANQRDAITGRREAGMLHEMGNSSPSGRRRGGGVPSPERDALPLRVETGPPAPGLSPGIGGGVSVSVGCSWADVPAVGVRHEGAGKPKVN